MLISWPVSEVGIATGYGLDGPGIKSQCWRHFPHLSTPVLGPTQLPWTMGTGSFLGVKGSQGMKLTPHPLLVPWSRKSRAIPVLPLRAVRPVQSLSACTTVHFTFTYTSNPPMDRNACTEPQCLYNGALYLYLYLYSLYGPYGLYRASAPVQRYTSPLPIPLIPLWTVQPVQSLSACTTVHFTFTYTSNPLWPIQPVQSLSACTMGHFKFTYTSTPPMSRTACTEPQCLNNGTFYLYLYLSSPYGPYSLYRSSVPVQRCTVTLPISLLFL